MKIEIVRLDLEKTKENWPAGSAFSPAYIQKFKHGQPANWHVLDAPLSDTVPPVWSHTQHDEYIRIPLFPYVLSPQADLALAFMLQLGLSCAGYFPGPVDRFFVATGSPAELLYDPDTDTNTGLRYWVGFAVILK
jgi:hypothetical protein